MIWLLVIGKECRKKQDTRHDFTFRRNIGTPLPLVAPMRFDIPVGVALGLFKWGMPLSNGYLTLRALSL